MNEQELIKKITDAQNDIKEGQEILRCFNKNKISEAEEFIEKCQRNIDYSPFIEINKLASNLAGNLSFKQLQFNQQLKVLDCVILSIKEFLIKISTTKTENERKSKN